MIQIPTLSQLYNQILEDIEAEYTVTIPLIGKNFLRALAAVQALKLKLFYLAVAVVQKNIFPDTADPESMGGTLERFGRVKLGRGPFPATAAQYEVEVTGTIGSIIPASTTFKSNDDSLNPGKLYVLDEAYTLTAETDTITIRALEGGLDSELSIADELTATAPIAGVNSLAEVTAEAVAPLDEEDIEEYREKVLNAYRSEPQGGAATDFRLWAFDAQGVANTYPYARSGASAEVNLYVEATTEDSSDGRGTPTNAILEAVEDVVELDPDTTKPISERGRRPLGVFEVHYLPVTIKLVEIDIEGFSGATAAVQTAIRDALGEAIDEIRPFVAAADILEDKNDILDKNKIIQTILNARPGSIFTGVTLYIDSAEESTWTFENGDIPYLYAVNFV
jgi:uncharacterized phage protein gp47/JayE